METKRNSIKSPTVLFIVLDFLAALILTIIIFNLNYSETESIASKEKIG